MRAWALRHQDTEASLAFIDERVVDVTEPAEILNVMATALEALSWIGGGRRNQVKADSALAIYAQVRSRYPENVGAYYLAGVQLLGSGRRSEAHPLLRRAAELSPDGARLHHAYWRSVIGLSAATEEDRRAEIEADMRRMLERRPTSTTTLFWISQGYDLMGDDERRSKMEDRIVEIDPLDRWAEMIEVQRYRSFLRAMGDDGWKDREKREQYASLVRAFLNRPKFNNERLIGDAYRSIFSVLAADSMNADPDELLEAVQGMVEYEGINPHIVFARGPIILAERGVYFEEAAEVARKGVEAGRKRIDEYAKFRGFATDGDYDKAVGDMTALMYDALGWVYFHEGRHVDAQRELLRARNLNPKSRDNLYHLGRLHEALHERVVTSTEARVTDPSAEAQRHLEQAESFYIKGMAVQHPGENPNEKALRHLYLRRHGTLDGISTYMSSLEEIDRRRRMDRVLTDRDKEPQLLPPFSLPSLEGPSVNSSTLSGRVAVINAW
ncbi:MAG: tetratricopeptide repeat protein, partial [Rhodothermales bacterium]|nr:tetratricopeptide repeat protein [Rhodothermales bacterium]